MKVTVTTMSDVTFTVDVSEDLTLENFKAICEVESGTPASQILVFSDGRPLTDEKKSLNQLEITDGAGIILQHYQGAASAGFGFNVPARATCQLDLEGIELSISSSESSTGSYNETEDDEPIWSGLLKNMRERLLNDDKELALLKQTNPKLAEAILAVDCDTFSQLMEEIETVGNEKEESEERLSNEDELDPEVQKRIEENIRQENVDANLDVAMEFHPESFGSVVMLYIDCKVNGHPVKAFIDSGSQVTVMSTRCAERCNLHSLIDSRFSGLAVGVGSQPILGRVHASSIQIGDTFLATSFSILEDQTIDMIFGLDMLLGHQCTIDLNRKVLVIGSTGTETQFLPEAELPRRFISNIPDDDTSSSDEEDVDLAEAIKESLRRRPDNKRGAPSTDSDKNKKLRKE
ncbi:Protein DDI1 2 [Orchesella cincta]|uniref:Protein DDI1 2 n=1 Tax=Orchesella cincta TaxID=48709 RepID=A0A1D2ME29_ORCCI|nr:Protein DDI1 2 [Orchesella cincta]